MFFHVPVLLQILFIASLLKTDCNIILEPFD